MSHFCPNCLYIYYHSNDTLFCTDGIQYIIQIWLLSKTNLSNLFLEYAYYFLTMTDITSQNIDLSF